MHISETLNITANNVVFNLALNGITLFENLFLKYFEVWKQRGLVI